MANTEKEIIPNNLVEIRIEQGLTQAELGKILKVSEKMVSYYETGSHNLPIDKAILISNKWNYDLNWIYKQSTDKRYFPMNDSNKEKPNFQIDIRKFIYVKNDQLHISIPDYFWQYIKKVNEIMYNNNFIDVEKKRLISQLNTTFSVSDSEQLFWDLEFDIDKFIPMLHFDDEQKCIYVNDANIERCDVTDEQLKEATSFLNFITDIRDITE